MSALKDKLMAIIKDAMKSGEKDRLTYARNLHAALKQKEIDERIELDDDAVIAIAATLAKQRQDSIDAAEKAGRADIADKEKAELAFLQTEILPAELSEDELREMIGAAISEAGAAGPKDMGKVMKALMPKTAGRADGGKVSARVKKALVG